MATLFTPEYKVLNELFGRDIKYIIPEYQRPYSWDSVGKSDKNNQINVMWDDLLSYFGTRNANPYFFGSMVMVGNDSSQEFEVIDGQQRLTSLTILFISIKCFLSQSKDRVSESDKTEVLSFIEKAIDLIDDIVFNKTIYGATELEKKVRIEKRTGFDYDIILKIAMECKDYIPQDENEDQILISKRYFDNRQYFIEKLKERFSNNGDFSGENARMLNDFIEFLKRRVAVVRILATSFDIAYQVFEILNNRGLPLSNKDLFRNFIIREFSLIRNYGDNDRIANGKWNDLEDNYEIDNDFLSRWVESKKATNQQYSAFNDLKEIYSSSYKDTINKTKIELLYDDILLDLENYSNIKNYNFESKKIIGKLSVILNAGNITYTMNLLLSLFRYLKTQNEINDENKIIKFLNTYEIYILYQLLGPSKRFVSKPIYDAIKDLNYNDFSSSLKRFALNSVEIDELKNQFSLPIKDNGNAKLLISKYFWVEWCSIEDDTVTSQLNYDNSTLEHIIPQNPDEKTNWISDFQPSFRKEWTYKLGNMTLLTKKKNSAAKNYDFSKKKIQYLKTNLALTKSLGELLSIDEDTIIKRHNKIVSSILKDLEIL